MIKYLKERITGGGKPKYTRAQVIGSRPIRNPAVQWDRAVRGPEQPSVALLMIPRRRDKWGNIVAKLLKLPDNRKLELDEIGSDVWEMCDGSFTVDAITRAISTKYRLNRRQSETSVTAYLRQLAERRLVAVQAKVKPAAASVPAAGQKRKRA